MIRCIQNIPKHVLQPFFGKPVDTQNRIRFPGFSLDGFYNNFIINFLDHVNCQNILAVIRVGNQLKFNAQFVSIGV